MGVVVTSEGEEVKADPVAVNKVITRAQRKRERKLHQEDDEASE